MVKLLSVIFFCAGAFIALSAFIPRVRLHWARTRIPCGFLGRLGAGSFFISVGVRFFLSDSLPESYRIWLACAAYGGLGVGSLGMALDKRRAKRAGMMQGSQTPLISKNGGDHPA